MRKKAFLMVVFLILLPFTLRAQWRVGIIEGIDYNVHSQSVHYMTDYNLHGFVGLTSGVSGQYSFYKWLGVRADLLFTQKNYNISRTDLSQVNYTYFNNYLLIPVMASFSFGGDNFPLRGFFNLGNYCGLWLTSHRLGSDINALTGKQYAFAGPVESTVKGTTGWIWVLPEGPEWNFAATGTGPFSWKHAATTASPAR